MFCITVYLRYAGRYEVMTGDLFAWVISVNLGVFGDVLT